MLETWLKSAQVQTISLNEQTSGKTGQHIMSCRLWILTGDHLLVHQFNFVSKSRAVYHCFVIFPCHGLSPSDIFQACECVSVCVCPFVPWPIFILQFVQCKHLVS